MVADPSIGDRRRATAVQTFGASPWLQLWLQFMAVQGMSAGFICAGQDAAGLP